MKLCQHPKFPKEEYCKLHKNNNHWGGALDTYNQSCDICYGLYKRNQALQELGELEILEPLNKKEIENIISNYCSKRGFTEYTDCAKYIYEHFGTRKLSVEEVEKFLANELVFCKDIDINHLASRIVEEMGK